MAKDKGKKEEKDGKKEKEEKKPELPYPAGMDVDYYGENGEYTFEIYVFSQFKKGIKASIRAAEGKKRINIETDEKGFYEYKAEKFDESEREFFFRVIGVDDVEWEETLDGPKPKEEERPKIEMPKIQTGGFKKGYQAVADYYKNLKGGKNE